MTVQECIQYGLDKLQTAGIDDAGNDVKLLAMHVLELNYSGLFMHMADVISQEQEERYKEYIEKRCTHYPCQYIIGTQDFMGYTFQVEEDVLIPRQETEILVETALEKASDKLTTKLLDVCCGSGCIGISYAKRRNEQGYKDEVTLLDISQNAIELSTKNAERLDVKVKIVASDLFDNIDEKYDIIVSNPPYIRTEVIEGLQDEVRLYEPRLALDGSENGLVFYERIVKEARKYLYENGSLLKSSMP